VGGAHRRGADGCRRGFLERQGDTGSMKDINSLIACLICLATGAAAIAAPPSALQARADAKIPQLLAEQKLPSVSLAHIEAGQIVFSAAYGLQAPGIRATTKTLYNIASLTKPISAEVILRLAAQGRLSLDEPMYVYWTDPDIANDERRKLLTPRLALSHQTGFPNWRRETGGVLMFKREPAAAYGYSGEGYEYLAKFADKKTGIDFEVLAQNLVLGPLHMTATSYTRRPWFTDRIAQPTDGQGKALEPEIADHWIASDLMYTTPTDYARFMQGVLRGDGLTPQLAKERSRIQVNEGSQKCTGAKPAGCPEAAGFGLGWEIIKLGGETYMMHGGSDEGVATFVYLNLTRQDGTVVFTNSSNGLSVLLQILDLIGADRAFIECLRDHAC
jgi:CubicO group peptidase (beta-lactamase class C family)